jgi:hypothetical protein
MSGFNSPKQAVHAREGVFHQDCGQCRRRSARTPRPSLPISFRIGGCKVYIDLVESLLKIHAGNATRGLLPSFGCAIARQSTQTERAD